MDPSDNKSDRVRPEPPAAHAPRHLHLCPPPADGEFVRRRAVITFGDHPGPPPGDDPLPPAA